LGACTAKRRPRVLYLCVGMHEWQVVYALQVRHCCRGSFQCLPASMRGACILVSMHACLWTMPHELHSQKKRRKINIVVTTVTCDMRTACLEPSSYHHECVGVRHIERSASWQRWPWRRPMQRSGSPLYVAEACRASAHRHPTSCGCWSCTACMSGARGALQGPAITRRVAKGQFFPYPKNSRLQ
jgi:hypothetical protein